MKVPARAGFTGMHACERLLERGDDVSATISMTTTTQT
jgi:nucleoside-diphosphate-sugar epimerase